LPSQQKQEEGPWGRAGTESMGNALFPLGTPASGKGRLQSLPAKGGLSKLLAKKGGEGDSILSHKTTASKKKERSFQTGRGAVEGEEILHADS